MMPLSQAFNSYNVVAQGNCTALKGVFHCSTRAAVIMTNDLYTRLKTRAYYEVIIVQQLTLFNSYIEQDNNVLECHHVISRFDLKDGKKTKTNSCGNDPAA
jgi:hypothetical protein